MSGVRHSWDLSPKAAIALQESLRNKIVLEDSFVEIKKVAGVDVAFEKRGSLTRAAIVVLDLDSLELVDSSLYKMPTTFPYVPGLLSFRELPAVLEAYKSIRIEPDLFLCDGQGIAHPRRLGIAAHLGLWLDKPSIGAKSRLIGSFDEPLDKKGAWTPLMDKGECIGAVLRTREKVKPLFISPGHRIGLESAIDYVMKCVTRYKLPETTRKAHHLAQSKEALDEENK